MIFRLGVISLKQVKCVNSLHSTAQQAKMLKFLQVIIAPVKSTVLNEKPQKECIIFLQRNRFLKQLTE